MALIYRLYTLHYYIRCRLSNCTAKGNGKSTTDYIVVQFCERSTQVLVQRRPTVFNLFQKRIVMSSRVLSIWIGNMTGRLPHCYIKLDLLAQLVDAYLNS